MICSPFFANGWLYNQVLLPGYRILIRSQNRKSFRILKKCEIHTVALAIERIITSDSRFYRQFYARRYVYTE